MTVIPARLLATLEHVLRRGAAVKDAQKRKRIGLLVATSILLYKRMRHRERPAAYVSRNVRFRGIWRNWRDAGLEHLEDRALIRFCGFSKAVVFQLTDAISLEPDMQSLCPGSQYWRRADPRQRPNCDVLDVLVLVLREMATVGYQHQLESDMGLHRGVLGRYLVRGKKVLMRILRAHPAARMGWFDHEVMEGAAHAALEEQHGPCPRDGVTYVAAIDGSITPCLSPADPELDTRYFSNSKRHHGYNTILLVNPFGTIMAYRACLPGNINDARAAEPIIEWFCDPAVNPRRCGLLADYGFCEFCNNGEHGLPPISRPYTTGKDTAIPCPIRRARVGEFSRWVCTCRQFNEWINGSAKRGFPRWLIRRDIRFLDELSDDMELYLHLYNFRVRVCQWSQTRTVYMEHALHRFAEQQLSYHEVDGVFDLLEPREGPPQDADD